MVSAKMCEDEIEGMLSQEYKFRIDKSRALFIAATSHRPIGKAAGGENVSAI